MTLAYTVYVDSIEEEAERIVDLASAGLQTAVRTCPGWTVEDLIVHLAGIYRRNAAQVVAPDPLVRVEPAAPQRLAPLAYLEASHIALVDALRERHPDDPCWNFTGENESLAFIARRIAHESSIHRVDAELTRGLAHPIDPELAADGLDERIDLLLRRSVTPSAAHPLGGSICLVCSDMPSAWLIDATRSVVKIRAGRGPANAAVVGTASDIFCFSWNRPSIRALQITGDRGIVDAWPQLTS